MLGVVETRTKHGHSARGNGIAFSGYAVNDCICEEFMARPERFELPTFWFVARRSIQLS
jgi:hypothetical protein